MKKEPDFAVIDYGRSARTGYPEAVYCAGKTVEQSYDIICNMCEKGVPVLGTHASPELAKKVSEKFPNAKYGEVSRILTIGKTGKAKKKNVGLVAVVCAGLSDLPIAKEAQETAEFYGSNVNLISDVGVAGIHRLFARMEEIKKARVVIAIAGMEGALASVIGGLVSVPVIAVPASVGYGANFGGLSALLGMLTACAPGISVVNIDNGFGAGYLANLINRGR